MKGGPFVLLTAARYYLQFTQVYSQSRISIAILSSAPVTFEIQELEADSAAECVLNEIVAFPFWGAHTHLMW